jgi:hypothetical protein
VLEPVVPSARVEPGRDGVRGRGQDDGQVGQVDAIVDGEQVRYGQPVAGLEDQGGGKVPVTDHDMPRRSLGPDLPAFPLGSGVPDVVCVQEMAARRDPLQLRAHAWATANALGMIPVAGSEGGISGNHPAILVSPHRLMILDDGPPPRQPGHDPA